MLIETLTILLAAAGQDASTLKLPPPPAVRPLEAPRSPDWARVLRVDRVVACSRPAQGQLVAYDQLPAEVLADLRRTDPQMSPPGGPFSPTDVWDGTSPFTRMIAAMRRGDRLSVAYERGGRGYGVTVLTYARPSARAAFAIKGVDPIHPHGLGAGAPEAEAAVCAALEQALGR